MPHPPKPPHRESVSRRAAGLSGLTLVLLLFGCLGNPSENELPEEAEPYVPLPDEAPESIGYFLTQYDKSLQRWTELKLSAREGRELRTLHALENNLTTRAREREEDLLVELESGPPTNREVAAVALGFTGEARNLAPLLAALNDESDAVVQKALLGIGILEQPDTPLAQITYLLRHHPDPWTRNNAAFALQRVVSAGGGDPNLPEDCRSALYDDEPGVRAQVASVLGMLHDGDSVSPLTELLTDDVNLVSAAAATALARIGRVELKKKGQCARALVASLDRLEGRKRDHVLQELVWLSERNLGDEPDRWREWAYKLP